MNGMRMRSVGMKGYFLLEYHEKKDWDNGLEVRGKYCALVFVELVRNSVVRVVFVN